MSAGVETLVGPDQADGFPLAVNLVRRGAEAVGRDRESLEAEAAMERRA